MLVFSRRFGLVVLEYSTNLPCSLQDVDIILSLGGHIHGGSYSVGFQVALNSTENISAFAKGVTSLVEATSVNGLEFK